METVHSGRPGSCGLGQIIHFDVYRYKTSCGLHHLHPAVDILSLGYWPRKNELQYEYEPPIARVDLPKPL